MVAFQLPTGKTVYLTLEKYLDLTDEDIQNLMADDKGVEIDDPFLNQYAPLYLEVDEVELNFEKEIPPDEVQNIKKEIKKEFNDNGSEED